jgi:hypothetical protein
MGANIAGEKLVGARARAPTEPEQKAIARFFQP